MKSVNFVNSDAAPKVREAEISDMTTIAKMAVKLCRQHHGYDVARFDLTSFEPLERRYGEYLAEQSKREDSSLLVVLLDEVIVGYAFLAMEAESLLGLTDQGVWLHDIYIDEKARGRGVGESLFRAIKSEAERLGSSFLMLSVSPKNIEGQRFFSKVGFRPTMQEMRIELRPHDK